MHTKYIIVTGGVISGLGKGITGASIGAILKSAGYRVFMQKLEGYLNVDAGTMNPYRHGEVYVLDDGTETDLDLGHYERFIDESLNKYSFVTSGMIYQEVIQRERRGDYLGRDIQVIPHVTDLVKEKIRTAAQKSGCDVMIVEIGGTIGDIESKHYIEAVRQLHREEGSENVIFCHVSYLPHIAVTGELKTKPTQQSVQYLRGVGITPDIIVARTDVPIREEQIEKISMYCDVAPSAVIPAPTVKTIYQVPLNFEKYEISKIITMLFKMPYRRPKMRAWQELVDVITKRKPSIKIAMAGKYTALEDAYISVIKALKAASYANGRMLEVVWVDTQKIEEDDKREWNKLLSVEGIVVPGGFGKRGVEGKIKVARYARENKVPYLGLCLGAQIMTLEFVRHVLKITDSHSQEFEPSAKHQVVHFLPGQHAGRAKGATLRLGAYECAIKKGTKAFEAYRKTSISERHRHRYEFNNAYRDRLEQAGMIISGDSPGGDLMEIVELKDHPFMLGSQFHPEFKSRPHSPHPLFSKFLEAAVTRQKELEARKPDNESPEINFDKTIV